jgi:type II secretory pathway pseudopilin PulG
MILFPSNSWKLHGFSLIETVIAMGVLAVAIPLVFGALAESGKSQFSSEAETRSSWMVPTCMDEILASRDGRPQFFTATVAAQTFPPSGDVWALAFSADGTPIGTIPKAIYEKGTKELNGQAVRYLASLSSATTTTSAGASPMLCARISIEFPATSPVARRQKLDFYTRIP